MTKLEKLQKAFLDAKAVYDAASAAYDAATKLSFATYDSWQRAGVRLSDHLKEQDDAEV